MKWNRGGAKPRTCVIGAGASGLPVIKALKDRGIPVTCFERTPNVGGLWCIDNRRYGASAAYDSLHINTDTRAMEYQDLPMPADLPAGAVADPAPGLQFLPGAADTDGFYYALMEKQSA